MVAFVVGVGAFALLVHTVGWAGIETAIAHVGISFVAIALIDLGSMFCDAAELYCFVRTQQHLGFWRVFAAQASGLAINRLTPTNSFGEPLKVTILMEDIPEATAVSAVLMFNLSTMLVATTTIVIGVPLTILMLDLPMELQLAVCTAVVGLVAIVVTVLVIVRRGALGAAIGALRRMRILSAERAERWVARSAGIDANLRRYGDTWSRRGLAFAAGSRVCSWIGTIVLLRAAGIELTLPLVLGVLTVGQLLMWLSNIIPFGIGLYDSGSYALYGALGASGAEGMGFAMVNRVRTCVLALIGLSVMFVAGIAKRRRT
ncbi:MAG: flippase-like domain-containing protein [Deltaproteobacteria bacterium]|nr:flippase-like domain-containing protein [Deltaproteobacteria bacterium]